MAMMPAEWAKHEATWLVWPHYHKDWPGKFDCVQWAFVEMTRALARGEIVRIIVQSAAQRERVKRMLSRAHADLGRVEFFVIPANRSWVRDSGPIFVKNGRAAGNVSMIDFVFNAWGRYRNWQRDNGIPAAIAKALKLPRTEAMLCGKRFVLEGGSIDVNGCGTLLTTEECLLDTGPQSRNPGATREDIESALKDYLGLTNILWLGHGITGDDTHGHVDDLARFVNPSTILLAMESDPKDANYRPLHENRERLKGMRLENGKKPEVIELPMPRALMFDGIRLPASYANFYIGNAVVLVPTFNDPNDHVALRTIAECFPDRAVQGIHAIDLVLGLGTIHCLTQQQPA